MGLNAAYVTGAWSTPGCLRNPCSGNRGRCVFGILLPVGRLIRLRIVRRPRFCFRPNCFWPDDTNWTGAEIKSCCRLASLLDVPLIQAAQSVAPVAVTAGDKIESLRHWASGRCLSADRAGVYSRSEGGSGSGGRVRRIVRAK